MTSKVNKVVPWIPVVGQVWSVGVWIKGLVDKRKKRKLTDEERAEAEQRAKDELDKILSGVKKARGK